MSRAVAAAIVLVLWLGGAHATEPQDRRSAVVVFVYPAVSREPGAVEVRVHIDRDEANRGLTVDVDSPAKSRRSVIALDGAGAPIRHRLVFRSLPAGRYTVVATVQRAGRSAARGANTFLVK